MSVISSRFCRAAHWANPSGPSRCNSWRVPGGRRGWQIVRRQRRGVERALGGLAGNCRIAVDDHIGEIGEQLGGTVAPVR